MSSIHSGAKRRRQSMPKRSQVPFIETKKYILNHTHKPTWCICNSTLNCICIYSHLANWHGDAECIFGSGDEKQFFSITVQ